MKKVLLAVALAFSMVSSMACYSDGIRVGTVQKFSQKGYVNKSLEGELVMEGEKFKGTANGTVRGGNVWAFSVLDPAVAKVIDEAAMSGSSVSLRYCQEAPLMGSITKFSTDTPYRITQAVIRK